MTAPADPSASVPGPEGGTPSEGCCCAHLRVRYRTERIAAPNVRGEMVEGLGTRGWWACDSCETVFVPAPVAADARPEAGEPSERERAHRLAMLALQSKRYQTDMDYRDAVDDVLAWTMPLTPPHRRAATMSEPQERDEELRRLEAVLADLVILGDACNMGYRPKDFADVLDMDPECAGICAAAANVASKVEALKQVREALRGVIPDEDCEDWP